MYTQKELLSLAKEPKDESQLYDSIFIIPRRQLHDSGFKMMYVIGAVSDSNKDESEKYHLLQTFSDVVDFGRIFGEGKMGFDDLHLDINPNGIIHIWTNSFGSKKIVKFKCYRVNASSCILEPVEV